MIVACGFDHAGVPLRTRLLPLIEYLGHDVLDLGTDSTEPIDYPEKALAVGQAVVSGQAQRGIVVCGSGAGVSVAACKIRGIRATTVHDTYTAHQAVEHDNLNVLCLGARVIGPELAADIVTAFLGAVFSGGERHVRRLAKVAEIEITGGVDPSAGGAPSGVAGAGRALSGAGGAGGALSGAGGAGGAVSGAGGAGGAVSGPEDAVTTPDEGSRQ